MAVYELDGVVPEIADSAWVADRFIDAGTLVIVTVPVAVAVLVRLPDLAVAVSVTAKSEGCPAATATKEQA